MNVPIHDVDSYEAYINRELSWLGFARRVLALAQDPTLPLLERVKFAGIMGPLLFGIVSQATGQSRLSILALVVFFQGNV